MVASRSDVEVVGIDLGEPQEGLLGVKNLKFVAPVDFESNVWQVRERSFDLTRCALLAGSVSNWPVLLERVKRWVEQRRAPYPMLT